jgi:hypothetical protein
MTSRSSSSRVIYHIPSCHVVTADWCFGNMPIILQPFVKLICSTVHTVAFRIQNRVTVSLVNVTFVFSCTHFVLSHHLDQSDHESHLKDVVLYSDWSYSSHSIHSHPKAFRTAVSVVNRALWSPCRSFVLSQQNLVTWLGSMCCVLIGSLN